MSSKMPRSTRWWRFRACRRSSRANQSPPCRTMLSSRRQGRASPRFRTRFNSAALSSRKDCFNVESKLLSYQPGLAMARAALKLRETKCSIRIYLPSFLGHSGVGSLTRSRIDSAGSLTTSLIRTRGDPDKETPSCK
jgi:hypothetical protein